MSAAPGKRTSEPEQLSSATIASYVANRVAALDAGAEARVAAPTTALSATNGMRVRTAMGISW